MQYLLFLPSAHYLEYPLKDMASNSNARVTAQEACVSLVKHYSDPIHYSSSTTARPADRDDDDDTHQHQDQGNLGQSAPSPYFDANHAGPMPELAPVSRFWYKRLLEICDEVSADADNETSSDMNTSSSSSLGALSLVDVARDVICCYESIIHPCIKKSGGTSSSLADGDDDDNGDKSVPFDAKIEVLRNYELLVAHLMRDVSNTKHGTTEKKITPTKKRGNLIEEIADIAAGGSSINSIEEEIFIQSTADDNNIHESDLLCKTIYTIADDIFQWSTELPKKDTLNLWKIHNILLPCLLRLIGHCVAVLLTPTHSCGSIPKHNTQTRKALSVATIAAAPFVGDGKSKSGAFNIGALLEWVCTDDKGEEGQKPPILSLSDTLPTSSGLPDSILSSNFMTRSVVDWSVPAAQFGAPWTDDSSGISSRVAMALLRKIQHCLSSPAVVMPETGESNSIQTLLRDISHSIGVDLLASTLRAHFFGRLSQNFSGASNAIAQKQSTTGVFMPMVSRIGSSTTRKKSTGPSSDGKPHLDIPIRQSAAAIILCTILPKQMLEFKALDKAISDALPIALSLLDDIQAINQATGALLLVSIIEASSLFKSDIPLFVSNFMPLISSSLESAIRISNRGEPTILTTMCFAQSKWVRYLGIYSDNPDTTLSPPEVCIMARKASSDILVAICKQAHTGARDGNDERIAGALVAGINPLIAQLATLPEAASVEIARMGLSTLLPLIGWSGMGLEIHSAQVSGLVGLISLMNSAYPIMPHHGKKIMTEVFLLLDRADKDAAYLSESKTPGSVDRGYPDDEISTEVTRKLALHTAAVSLVICGKSAESVLEHIESTRASMQRLMDHCLEIRTISRN